MNVELLAITPNGEELVASAYGICTNKTVCLENIAKWMNMGHLSPLEHISATFLIEGISRACLAQLTRHRLCSFSVASMRFISAQNEGCVVPSSVEEAGYSDLFKEKVLLCHQAYYEMTELKGIPKEDARMVLPLGTTTRLIMTANARQWLHVFSQRITPQAQWEVRRLCMRIRAELMTEWPHIILGSMKKEADND